MLFHIFLFLISYSRTFSAAEIQQTQNRGKPKSRTDSNSPEPKKDEGLFPTGTGLTGLDSVFRVFHYVRIPATRYFLLPGSSDFIPQTGQSLMSLDES